jgi:glycosyltransferase involved in cell wall biosynthesis
MKITCYSHYFAPEIGAPTARIYDLAQQWLALGHGVQVVTCFPNHPHGRLYEGYQSQPYLYEKLDGIDVHRSWTYITPNKGIAKKTLGHISYLPSALVLSEPRLRQSDVLIGTSPTFFAPLAAAVAGAARRIPYVMEVRDLWPAIFVELGVVRNPHLIRALEQLEMLLYRRASRVVTVTEAFRQNIVGRGLPDWKVVTIPNGADVDYWQPETGATLRARLGLDDRFVVLYIGAHGISHALAKLLDSIAELRDQPEIQFVFVGEGAEKDALVQRAQQLGLPNVQFLESVPKAAVREFYAMSDVCLVPLRDIPLFDTFIPSKMFEIMAMARPMVASVRGEAADILRRSGAAIVVPPEDSRAITAAIRHLAAHRGEARALGERGRAFVVDHYSRRALATRYLDVLGDAVAKRRGRRR